ncbi:glycoside hydrolase family 3 protein [Kutzneria kofuensis]|uniref:Exo-alpha-(1->6)-L-arabinopyranosidase n=1 Tax=Kutzneria kofuensis TaxID=103725 RepID=A0A7W9KCZ7_9PSEU|nr:glycoside hydrolase family 3 protein [Kutzneria kofuensis]MBB5890342.1 beta-glucosidase [Kutzneria kofuensis]
MRGKGLTTFRLADTGPQQSPTPRQVADDLVATLSIAEKIELTQQTQPALPRLGLPAADFTLRSATDGVESDFPLPLGLGSSWDPELVMRVGAAMADEIRASGGGLVREIPLVNPSYDPRHARNERGFGEDPLLCSKLGAVFALGLRGPEKAHPKTVPVVRHVDDLDRCAMAPGFNLRVFNEYEMPVFRAVFETGGAAGIVLSQMMMEDFPALAAQLLQLVLRGWSDGEAAIWSEKLPDRPLTSGGQALALRLGADAFMGGGRTVDAITEAYRRGEVTEAMITAAARRMLMLRLQLLASSSGPAKVDRKAHRELVRRAARESIVLLRNDGLLPLLVGPGMRLAVIGPHGEGLATELGRRVTAQYVSGSDRVTVPGLDGEFELTEWRHGRFTLASETETLEAITGPDGTMIDRDTEQPLEWQRVSHGIADAVALAREADVVVLAVGSSPELDDGNRSTLELPSQQHQLVRAVRAANPNVVLVVRSGYPYALRWEDTYLPAILWSEHSGRAADRATAEILFGDHAPSGRLPQTWYRADADLPPTLDYDLLQGSGTYLYQESEPLYAFGHGLTYTTFAYEDLDLSSRVINADQAVTVTVRVRNTGFRDCHEVVQLYTRQLNSQVRQPRKVLRDFKKVLIPARECRTVTFRLRAADLCFWDVTRDKWVVETALHEVFVGTSSAKAATSAVLDVHGRTLRPRTLARTAIDAHSYDESMGLSLVDMSSEAGPVVSAAKDGAWLGLLGYDPSGCRSWSLTASNAGDEPAPVELRCGAPDGRLLGTVLVPPTTDHRRYAVATGSLMPVDEVSDLFVVFPERGPWITRVAFA